jgi:hypothetical protein
VRLQNDLKVGRSDRPDWRASFSARICDQRVCGAFAGSLRSSFGAADRSGDDHVVPIRYCGLDPRQGAGWLRATRDRALPDAHSPGEHPGNRHIGQSGALDRTGADRRRRRGHTAVAILGRAARWRRSRRPHLSLAERRAAGAGYRHIAIIDNGRRE